MTAALATTIPKIHGSIIYVARFELEPRKAKGKRVLDLDLSKIAVIGRGKFGLNKKILEITTTDGEQYRFNIDDDKAAMIRAHLAQWSQLVEAGPERWQVYRRRRVRAGAAGAQQGPAQVRGVVEGAVTRLALGAAFALWACGGAAPPPPKHPRAPGVVQAEAAPAPEPAPEPPPPPRPDCSSLVAHVALDQVRAYVEDEGCNGHAWDGRRTPLVRAAERGDADLAAFLLDAGAPVDFTVEGDKTALWFAVGGGHTAVVERLLAAGADPNHNPTTALPLVMLAALHDHVDSARLLVEAGADPAVPTSNGDTVMNYASGPGARVFAYLVGLGMPTDGLTQEQVDSLLWEAAHQPAADASVEDRVELLLEVVGRARTGASRERAIQALGKLGADARAATQALIDVILGEPLGTYDWSRVYAADALREIGWTPELDRALPKLRAALPDLPNQARLALVEMIEALTPATSSN